MIRTSKLTFRKEYLKKSAVMRKRTLGTIDTTWNRNASGFRFGTVSRAAKVSRILLIPVTNVIDWCDCFND